MVCSLLSVFAFSVATVAQAPSPIAPVRIEPTSGGGNPIMVSVTGMEQDPVPLTARWNGDDACLADVACFVSSWMEANTASTIDHLLIVRAPDERTDLQRRYADPQLIARNSARFKQVRAWSLLGWIDYGGFRIVMLAKDDPSPSTPPIYTLPIKKAGARWGQTDALATDTGIYQVLDRLATAILERRRKK
jgi:hypothetical protein